MIWQKLSSLQLCKKQWKSAAEQKRVKSDREIQELEGSEEEPHKWVFKYRAPQSHFKTWTDIFILAQKATVTRTSKLWLLRNVTASTC